MFSFVLFSFPISLFTLRRQEKVSLAGRIVVRESSPEFPATLSSRGVTEEERGDKTDVVVVVIGFSSETSLVAPEDSESTGGVGN